MSKPNPSTLDESDFTVSPATIVHPGPQILPVGAFMETNPLALPLQRLRVAKVLAEPVDMQALEAELEEGLVYMLDWNKGHRVKWKDRRVRTQPLGARDAAYSAHKGNAAQAVQEVYDAARADTSQASRI